MAETRTYRHIPLGSGACSVCDRVIPYRWSRVKVGQKVPVRVHGPKGNRCPGSGQPPRRWLEASGLPGWGDMSDLDRGAALLHIWKRKWEGGPYAIENYPVRYFDDPVLVALDRREASRHAVLAAGYHDQAVARLGVEEHSRLYDLALDHERREVRPDA